MLDREFVFLGIRKAVSVVEGRRATYGSKCAKEVGEIVIGKSTGRILGGEVEGRLRCGEKVLDGGACGTILEGSGEGRRELAGVVSERSVPDFVEVRCSLKGAVEDSPADTKAGGTGGAEYFSEHSIMPAKRIGQAEARCEIVPAGGRERTGNVRVAGKHPALG